MATIIIFFVLNWYLSLFMQTAFLHRYAAHRTYTMSPRMEKVCFVLTWLFQGPGYLSARAYGILHRLHHSHVDTEEDPHSPSYDRSIFAMMWRTAKIYTGILTHKIEVDPRYTKNLPVWDSFDRFASAWQSRIAFGVAYVLFFLWVAPPVWMYALLPVLWIIGPVHGAIINWFAHKWGYRNFNTKDTSKNFLPFDFLMLGESYHNNHHAHQKNPNFGHRFFEVDFTYLILRLLDRVGVIQLVRETDENPA
jgi:stearoyl-CoA desaturase (delta-9 desaturase)